MTRRLGFHVLISASLSILCLFGAIMFGLAKKEIVKPPDAIAASRSRMGCILRNLTLVSIVLTYTLSPKVFGIVFITVRTMPFAFVIECELHVLLMLACLIYCA